MVIRELATIIAGAPVSTALWARVVHSTPIPRSYQMRGHAT